MSSPEDDRTGTGKRVKTEGTKDDDAAMSELPPDHPGAETEDGTAANNSTHRTGSPDSPGSNQEDGSPDPGPRRTDAESEDDDAEPQLLQDDSVSQDLFPNAPCVTVAKRGKRGSNASPIYLNRYGPRRCGWFVWSSELKGSVEVEKLQDAAYNYDRVLDHPRKRSEPHVGASQVQGIINIIWECPGLEDDPLQAAELLNPKKVKQADSLSSMKARQDWLKQPGHKLDKYPVTHVDVKFSQDMQALFPEEKGPIDTRWELGSKYKALYRRASQIEVETKVYKSALNQAHRFLDWYRKQNPASFDEKGTYRRSESREPTLQPFDDKSPSPGPVRSGPREPSVSSTTPVPPGDQTRQASVGPDASKPGPAARPGKPGREMIVRSARTAYKMNTGKTDETMNEEDDLTLDMFTTLQLQKHGYV